MKDEISYRNIWGIAYPIIIGSVSQTILNITDTIYLGHLGELELGAGALGALFYLALMMVITGFTIGNQIIIARRFGESRMAEIGNVFSNSAIMLLGITSLVFIAIKFIAPTLIPSLVSNPQIAHLVDGFIQYRIWGIFAAGFTLLFRAFYVGTANTKILIAVTTSVVGLNVILNYALIFGKFGFAAMGFNGAALASVISESVGFIIIISYTLIKKHHHQYKLFRVKPFKLDTSIATLKLASPVMLQHLISFSAWFVVFLIIERMGERSLAISNIVRSLYIAMMVPIWGFAEATNSLVSYLMGEKHFDKIGVLVKRSALMSLASVAIVVAIVYAVLPQIIAFYTPDLTLVTDTIPVAKVVMIGATTMSLAFVVFMAVSGTGNTLIAFGLEFSDVFFYIVLAFILVEYTNANVTTIWFIETFYAAYMLIICSLYLKYGKWRSKII